MKQSQEYTTCSCGRGQILTGYHRKHNARVDGKEVCPECFLDSLYKKKGKTND